MLLFAITTGIFSYLIFFLGLFELLYKNLLAILFLIYVAISIVILISFQAESISGSISLKKILNKIQQDKLIAVSISLLFIQEIINLIGTLGPELSFDALWYHLTLPKVYLINHNFFFIPGSLFYYSSMPKLGEMIYTAGLSAETEIIPKLIHYFFGVLILFLIYKISRFYLNKIYSLIAVLIFSSSLVFDWLQITAYIDLIRTFFSVFSFYYLLKFVQTKNNSDLFKSYVLIGFSISTKLISAFDLVGIDIFLIIYFLNLSFPRKWESRFPIRSGMTIFKNIFFYNLIAVLIPLPWFIFSYANTGNPIYPFLTNLYPSGYSIRILNPLVFIKISWNIFTNSPDPLSTLFLIFIPIILVNIKKFKKYSYLLILAILVYLSWYFTPQTGGGRFILPFIAIFSTVCSICLNLIKDKFIKIVLLIAIFLSIIISIIFRFGANYKYVPVILGRESKSEFLCKNLNFNFGDFYDCDNYFKLHVKATDRVLLINFHNEYYVDFPFIDESFLKPTDKFNYIAVQNADLAEKYKNWKLIYTNNLTHVKLYKR